MVEFSVRRRASYLIFFAGAIAGETLTLNILRSRSASEAAEDWIEITLIASVTILIWGGLVEISSELEKRTRFPIWPVVLVGTNVLQVAGIVAVIVT